ncbi:hypothetical protein E2C01_088543 [Portunus trituberculatus]|uniref:Uncharacterized protein n=1 Tax=Portunus trituberculatus TaxID=210409 RepID=A0A5B7JJN6_PORTR|nr:hypothetical protein [Portunus trituberculatus]
MRCRVPPRRTGTDSVLLLPLGGCGRRGAEGGQRTTGWWGTEGSG